MDVSDISSSFMNVVIGGFPTDKTHPEKICRKSFLYGSILTKASRMMAKPTMLSTLQRTSSFGGSSPFLVKAANTISSTLDDL